MMKHPPWGASFLAILKVLKLLKYIFFSGNMGQIQDIGIVERIH